ncbi:MAG: hypothetical protein CMJ78_05685 [Planctomycetaceae bacterium]|nr:hypothetical protein [Planctomycetaceae bacterium]
MSFLLEYDHADPRRQAQLVGEWLNVRHRELFAELRRDRPILNSPGAVIVTKYRDVTEVLARDEVFSVRAYRSKMEEMTGPFILSEDDTPTYQRDKSVLRLAIRREDIPAIRRFVTGTSQELIKGIGSKRFNVVSEYTYRLPTRLVQEYFGVPGPDEKTLQRWLRTIFFHTFLNLGDSPEVREPAVQSSSEMVNYLAVKIADAMQCDGKGGSSFPGGDILHRLVQLRAAPQSRLTPQEIRHNLIGLTVGVVDGTSRAIAQILRQLFDRPEQLAAAKKAAREDDDELLERYVFEALRFDPQNKLLVRFSEKPCTLGKGTTWKTDIPPPKAGLGSDVIGDGG